MSRAYDGTARAPLAPMQARSSPNHQQVRVPAPLKTTMAPPSTTSHRVPSPGPAGTTTSRPRSGTSSASSRTPQPPAQSQPRPTQQRDRAKGRLATEKPRDHKDPASIGPWKLDRLIGQGASGRVRLATHMSTGQQAAVKIVPRQVVMNSRMSLRDAGTKQEKITLGIEREIVIMKLIEHPNLLGLWDVYETAQELYLIMEYVAGGELFDHLVAEGRLKPAVARDYFRQIISGMDYCHAYNICHRDLKPENLLLDKSKKIVKVADFGMAALQPQERMLETSCGSPHYASPEIVAGKAYVGSASDIWSCGIILFALLNGRLPFDDPNIQVLLQKVKAGRFEMPPSLEPHAQNLIWRMLEIKPEERITMEEIMCHPWFTNNGQFAPGVSHQKTIMGKSGSDAPIDILDDDILGNLKTLWPEYNEAYLREQLACSGPNWQKTFYSLLHNHREKHADDEDDDDEDDVEAMVLARAPGNSLGLSLGIGAGADRERQQKQEQQKERERARPRRSMEGSSSRSSRTEASSSSATSSTVTARAHVSEAHSPARGSSRQQTTAAHPALVAHRVAPSASPARAAAAAASAARAHLNTSPERTRGPAIEAPRSPAGPRASMDQSRPAVRPSPARATTDYTSSSATRASIDANRSPARASLESSRPAYMASPALNMRKPLPSPEMAPDGVFSFDDNSRTPGSSRRAASPTRSQHTPSVRVSKAESTPSRSSRSQASDSTPKPSVRGSSRATSPSKGRPVSTYSATGAPTINVPLVSDPVVQRFLDEIYDGFAHCGASEAEIEANRALVDGLREASSRAAPSSRPASQAGHRSSSRPASRTGSRRGSVGGGRRGNNENQFEDADEDSADDADDVLSVASESSGYPRTPTSPLPPMLSSPGGTTAPLAVHNKDYRGGRRPSIIKGATSPRQGSMFSTNTTSSTGTDHAPSRRKSLLGRLRSGSASADSAPPSDNARASVAYERLQDAAAARAAATGTSGPMSAYAAAQAAGTHSSPTRLQQKNPGLGLDIAQGAPSIAAPAIRSSTGTSSPIPSFYQETVSPRQSWFGKLMNWKVQSFTLHSTEGFSVTHDEVKRLLQNTGARVFVEDSENTGVLKCSLAEVREAGGKPVRFRVEFYNAASHGSSSAMPSPALSATSNSNRLSAPSPVLSTYSRSSAGSSGDAMWLTNVIVHHEKGTPAGFKRVCELLKRSWTLGSMNSAPPSPAPASVGLGVTGAMSPHAR